MRNNDGKYGVRWPEGARSDSIPLLNDAELGKHGAERANIQRPIWGRTIRCGCGTRQKDLGLKMVLLSNSPVRFALLRFLILFVALPSFAGLKWEKKVAGVEPHPLQTSTTIDFIFTNTGDEVVKITDLRPGCGCISGKIEKKEYAPGESGVVNMTFDFGKRTGSHRKGLEVRTDEPSVKSVDLYISARIPETYTPSIPSLKWAVGGESAPQSFRLLNSHSMPIKLVKAEAPGDKLKLELKVIREGYEYELVVTPAASAVTTRGLIPIKIHPEVPEGMDVVKIYTVYAMVR